MLLTNSYFTALAVPMALLCCGALAKKLVRGSKWVRGDFYLGVEFTLAALSSALIYIFEIARGLSQTSRSSTLLPLVQSLAGTASFIAVTFCLLLVVLSIHQDWERQQSKRRGQIIWLCIISNIIGAGLIAGFVLLVKGVQ